MEQSTDIINIKEENNMPVPLSVHVKETVEQYFAQLNGHDTTGLYTMVISEVEKPLLEATMKYCNDNQTKASKLLGLSRSTLRKKIELYQL